MPADPPDISVVTATFQRPSLVVEAVRSALSQEGPRVEVIVVDDDPAASAKAAVEAIGDARVSYVVREKTSGGVPALVYNDGLARAQGKTVLFLDDDDVLEPGAFKLLFEALEQKPEAAFAFGRTEPFGGAPDVMVHEMAFFLDASSRARNARSAGTRYLLAQLLFGSTLFVVSSCLFRTELLRSLGGFRPKVRIQPHTDVAVRAARKHGWTMVDEKVARYRVQAGSLMHDQKNLADLHRSYEEIYKGFRAEFGFIEYARLKFYSRSMR